MTDRIRKGEEKEKRDESDEKEGRKVAVQGRKEMIDETKGHSCIKIMGPIMKRIILFNCGQTYLTGVAELVHEHPINTTKSV